MEAVDKSTKLVSRTMSLTPIVDIMMDHIYPSFSTNARIPYLCEILVAKSSQLIAFSGIALNCREPANPVFHVFLEWQHRSNDR